MKDIRFITKPHLRLVLGYWRCETLEPVVVGYAPDPFSAYHMWFRVAKYRIAA